MLEPKIDLTSYSDLISDKIEEIQAELIESEYPSYGVKAPRLFGERELREIFDISAFELKEIREGKNNVTFTTNMLGQHVVDIHNLESLRKYLHEKYPDKGYIVRFDKTFTISVSVLKGGAGKSFVSQNLSQFLSLYYGLRVLLIDLDAQATTSVLTGKHPGRHNNPYGTIYPYMTCLDNEAVQSDVSEMYGIEMNELFPRENTEEDYSEAHDFADMDDPKSIIRGKDKRYWPNMDVIYANLGLYNYEMVTPELSYQDRFSKLTQYIDSVGTDYDVVIIDCPPSFSYTFSSALVAADGIIIPTPAKAMDFVSSGETLRYISQLSGMFGSEGKKLHFIEPIIPNINLRSETEKSIAQQIEQIYGSNCFRIRDTELVKRANEFVKTAFDIDPKVDTSKKNPEILVNSQTYQNGIYPIKRACDYFAKKILASNQANTYERTFHIPPKFQDVDL